MRHGLRPIDQQHVPQFSNFGKLNQCHRIDVPIRPPVSESPESEL